MKLGILFLTLLLMAFFGNFYSNKALSFKFVDEQYNFTIGKYLTYGEILYDDVITNHQPLAHILSYQVQTLTKSPNIYILVKRHRQAIIVWSTVWALLLVSYFGIGALIFIILFETSKINLLGNLFLAESLTAYPLVFLLGLTLFLKNRLNNIELIFFGLTCALLGFTLGPIVPVLFLILLLLIFKQRPQLIRALIYLSLGMLISFLYVYQFTSVLGYLKYYLLANLTYTVPAYQSEPWILIIFKSFLTPIVSFFPNATTSTLTLIRISAVLLLINTLVSGKYKKMFLLICFLGLINLRFVSPGTEGYAGFHILPWYAVFIFTVYMNAFELLKQQGSSFLKYVGLSLIFLAVMFGLNSFKDVLFTKTDPILDYQINYSTHESVGNIIKILRSGEDSLFVSPDAWLVYWQSDTQHLPKLFGYYPWMLGIPSLQKSILQALDKNPPTFIYCDNCMGSQLEKYLLNYQELKREGGQMRLYVLKEKIKKLTNDQIAQLNYHKISFD